MDLPIQKSKLVLFNKQDIEVVYHYGYVDQKELRLDELLTEAEAGKKENKEQ
nr:DUF4176 domain-containing protein [Bacillus licheniformis]